MGNLKLDDSWKKLGSIPNTIYFWCSVCRMPYLYNYVDYRALSCGVVPHNPQVYPHSFWF